MKLFFSPGACSLSPHIVLHEAGLAHESERVDLKKKVTASGADFTRINPKGYVPTLQLDNGEVLTEGPAIVQYLADQKPASGLAPANGTLARYRLQEWLNYISTELHKGFAPLFNPATSDEVRNATVAAFLPKLDYLAGKLAGNDYLMGADFTVADGYLFVVLSWTPFAGIDLGNWPAIKAFVDRVAARPKVQEAQAAEKAS